MKFYNYLFPFIISCFFVSGSFAATGGDPYGPDGKYTAHFGQSRGKPIGEVFGDCEGVPTGGACVSGTTCICDESTGHNNICLSCAEYREGEYPYSDNNAVSYGACYKFCAPDPIEHGQKEPDFLTAYDPNNCTYYKEYVYCENESDKCNGYHAEGEGEDKKCVPNMRKWSDEATGESGWEQWNETGWVKYTTGCGSDSHLEPNATNTDTNSPEWAYIMCAEYTSSNIAHGKCVSNNRNCSDYFGTNCKNNDKSGTVGGKPSWSDKLDIGDSGWRFDWEETVGVAGGGWDFGECYCEIEGVETGAGTATQHCFWGDSGPWGEDVEWSGGCETESFTKCAAGNCDIDNSGICKSAPAGYYGDGTTMACQPCPMGATSAGGATGKNCCYMRVGSSPTQFCDRVGCFDLGAVSTVNVPYDNTECKLISG